MNKKLVALLLLGILLTGALTICLKHKEKSEIGSKKILVEDYLNESNNNIKVEGKTPMQEEIPTIDNSIEESTTTSVTKENDNTGDVSPQEVENKAIETQAKNSNTNVAEEIHTGGCIMLTEEETLVELHKIKDAWDNSLSLEKRLWELWKKDSLSESDKQESIDILNKVQSIWKSTFNSTRLQGIEYDDLLDHLDDAIRVWGYNDNFFNSYLNNKPTQFGDMVTFEMFPDILDSTNRNITQIIFLDLEALGIVEIKF